MKTSTLYAARASFNPDQAGCLIERTGNNKNIDRVILDGQSINALQNATEPEVDLDHCLLLSRWKIFKCSVAISMSLRTSNTFK
jgi:hypothetical protein